MNRIDYERPKYLGTLKEIGEKLLSDNYISLHKCDGSPNVSAFYNSVGNFVNGEGFDISTIENFIGFSEDIEELKIRTKVVMDAAFKNNIDLMTIAPKVVDLSYILDKDFSFDKDKLSFGFDEHFNKVMKEYILELVNVYGVLSTEKVKLSSMNKELTRKQELVSSGKKYNAFVDSDNNLVNDIHDYEAMNVVTKGSISKYEKSLEDYDFVIDEMFNDSFINKLFFFVDYIKLTRTIRDIKFKKDLELLSVASNNLGILRAQRDRAELFNDFFNPLGFDDEESYLEAYNEASSIENLNELVIETHLALRKLDVDSITTELDRLLSSYGYLVGYSEGETREDYLSRILK